MLLLESALCGIYPCTKIDFARNPCKTAKIKIDLVIVRRERIGSSPIFAGWLAGLLFHNMSYTMSVFFTHTPQYSKIFTKISHTHTFTPLFDIQTLKTYMPHIHMAFHNRFIWAMTIGLESRVYELSRHLSVFFISSVYMYIWVCMS